MVRRAWGGKKKRVVLMAQQELAHDWRLAAGEPFETERVRIKRNRRW